MRKETNDCWVPRPTCDRKMMDLDGEVLVHTFIEFLRPDVPRPCLLEGAQFMCYETSHFKYRPVRLFSSLLIFSVRHD